MKTNTPYLLQFVLLILTLCINSLALASNLVLGPEIMARTTKAPQTETYQFSANAGVESVLKLELDRVSSAIVTLNGSEIFGPSDFNQQVETLSADVTLQSSNTLTIELRGKPEGSLTVNVEQLNQPPVITSVADTEVFVGRTYTYDVDATDPDNDVLTYSLVTAPTGMTIDARTGQINWIPEAIGEYQVIIGVTDNINNPIDQTFTINVPNRGPYVISQPVNTANINDVYQYQVRVLEMDGDTLSYTLVISPFGMTIDSTGLIEWIPNVTGQVDVEFIVDDNNFATHTQQYTLNVIDPNVNYDPEITSTSVTEGIEGVLYEYKLETVDLNNDTITYQLLSAPPDMSIDAESGRIKWAQPVPGSYNIEVTASDPELASDTQTYTLNVLTLNEADTMFQGIMDDMNNALLKSDVEAALQCLTPSAQKKYEVVFNNLLPNMGDIVASYSQLERVSITPSLAQYAVSRTVNGEDRIFLILLMNTENGWRISSM